MKTSHKILSVNINTLSMLIDAFIECLDNLELVKIIQDREPEKLSSIRLSMDDL
jgi:hypothetical protein